MTDFTPGFTGIGPAQQIFQTEIYGEISTNAPSVLIPATGDPGFSLNKVGAGDVIVTFGRPFASAPSVVASAGTGLNRVVSVVNITANSFELLLSQGGAAINGDITFFATTKVR